MDLQRFAAVADVETGFAAAEVCDGAADQACQVALGKLCDGIVGDGQPNMCRGFFDADIVK